MRTLSILFIMLLVAGVSIAEEALPETSYDGLKRVEDARVATAYIDPNADFSVFQRVAILDPYVAFRANWQRDQNRNSRTNVRTSDMERIKADVAFLFRNVFTERLEAAGFQVVNVANDDVLALRPAIIDLDITAPDVRRAGRTRTFTASTGAATLFLELVDSQSGATLVRAVDRRSARRAGGSVNWSNRVTNSAEARRVVGRWADLLVEFLQENNYAPDVSTADTAAEDAS